MLRTRSQDPASETQFEIAPNDLSYHECCNTINPRFGITARAGLSLVSTLLGAYCAVRCERQFSYSFNKKRFEFAVPRHLLLGPNFPPLGFSSVMHFAKRCP